MNAAVVLKIGRAPTFVFGGSTTHLQTQTNAFLLRNYNSFEVANGRKVGYIGTSKYPPKFSCMDYYYLSTPF